MTLHADRVAKLERLTLLSGSHGTQKQGMCAMEAVAWVSGEKHSDHPKCACPILSAFMRRWNDDLDSAGRQRLKPYISRLVGTKAMEARKGPHLSPEDWESRRARLLEQMDELLGAGEPVER